MTETEKLPRRLVWSMRLILGGLVVELLSLFGLRHPMGFMAFAAIGCTLMGAGIALFLSTVLSKATPR